MHFMIHRDLKSNALIRSLLIAYGVGLGGYLALRPWIESHALGLLPADLNTRLLGDPTHFIQAMNRLDVATQVHTKLFFDSLIAVVLGAVTLRLTIPLAVRRALMLGIMVLPALEALSVGGILLGFPLMAEIKCALFFALWGLQLIATIMMLLHLITPRVTHVVGQSRPT